jgi:hypothetical protein
MKTALICGISSQDGAYLARLLLYYPLILFLNLIIESPRHFTHVAMSYMVLLALQMVFFLLFPVTTPVH